MKKKLTALLAAAMLLTACGGSKEETAEIKEFKDYIVMGSDFETLNSMNTSAAVDIRCITQNQANLLTNDIYGNIVGDLAESWEYNEDYTVWTFKLREGLKWVDRDGNEVGTITANDCVASAKWALTAENGSTCTEMMTSHLVGAEEYLAGEITDFAEVGIKAVDDLTVEYTLKISAPWFDTVTMYPSFMPVAQEALDKFADKYGNSPDTIWYSGPFIMTEYTADQEKVYTKNEAYWDVANVDLDKVTVIAVKDTESTKELFERGELDYCTLVGTQPIKENENGNEYMFQTDAGNSAYCLYFNSECSDPDTATLMANENFRQAMFYGWNKFDYVEQSDPLNPEAIYAEGFTGRGFVFTSDGTDYCDLGNLANYKPDMYDQAKGMEYWEAAKAELEGKVTWPIEIPWYIKAGNETASNTAQILKYTLEETFGADYITLKIGEYNTSFRSEVQATNAHGMMVAGWGPDYRDPMNVMGCVVPGPGGYMNNVSPNGYSHWDYPEFVDMYNEACEILDDMDARYTAFANAEAYLLDHAYYMPIYCSGATYRMTRYNPYSRLHGYSGGEGTSYKKLTVYDHILTAEEVANFKAEWQAGRNK